MSDDDNKDSTQLPPANDTEPYKFSESSNRPNSTKAVQSDDDGKLPEPNDTEPFKKGA